ncbi:NAD(P)/FAD-dependent oxidoreductase [bacterium]|nr:NAD(P)/FAD-dependent oxidoreductase [bacterium]
MRYDLIVVGAGPAGSSAAYHAVRSGLSVLLVEKRQQVGLPVRCAEAVGHDGFAMELGGDGILFPDGPGGDLSEPYRAAHINGGITVSPGGNRASVKKEGAGWVLERKLFDLYLAERAAEAGAELWVKTQALDAERVGGEWRVRVRRLDREETVGAPVLIGADGVEGLVGRWAGLTGPLPLADVHSGAQVLAAGLPGWVEEETVYFFLGSNVAPGGYAWLFPKGRGLANVGLGIPAAGHPKPARGYLRDFLTDNFPEVSILEEVHGCVPTAPPPRGFVGEGCMLVGDAARQVDPFSGAGINWSLEAGRLAGETAAEVLLSGVEPTAKALTRYEKHWQARHRREHRQLYKFQTLVMSLTDGEVDQAVAALAAGVAKDELGEVSPLRIIGYALRGAPGLFLKLRHLL